MYVPYTSSLLDFYDLFSIRKVAIAMFTLNFGKMSKTILLDVQFDAILFRKILIDVATYIRNSRHHHYQQHQHPQLKCKSYCLSVCLSTTL